MYCFEFLHEENNSSTTPETLHELNDSFNDFVISCPLFKNFDLIWKKIPKSTQYMSFISRILMGISLMDVQNLDFLINAKLIPILIEILGCKDENICTDVLFAVSNFILMNCNYILFIKSDIFPVILTFLHFSK